MRLHAVIGGDGPPLLLVHGWPETWYAWRLVMPALARDFEVIAVDQRGIGLSDKPEGGYDTGTLANDLVALMDALGHERFAVVGHDTGFAISYALAADHPDRVERVALAEIPGPPGAAPSPPVFVPEPRQRQALAHPVQPAREAERTARPGTGGHLLRLRVRDPGREQAPDDVIDYYVGLLSNPDSLRGSLRVLPRSRDTTMAQNEERRSGR